MKRFPLLLLTLLSTFYTPRFAVAAATAWQSNPQGEVRLLSSLDTVPPSGELLLGLHFKPAPGWYVYWKFAGDSGYPPKVSWKGSTGITGQEILWPAPTHIVLPGKIDEYGYDGEVVYPVRAKLTGGKIHIQAQLSYLTCYTACIPYKYTFSLDLTSGPQAVADPVSDAMIRQFLARVPATSLSDETIQRNAPTIEKHPGEEAPSSTRSVALSGILLLAFIGGVILNVMPCVLPVLSIKLLGLLQHSGQARHKIIVSSLSSAAGIIASFIALALAAILARRAGMAVGWGIQFQQPVFLGFLALVIFLFALNLWGVFEISMPRFVGHFATTYGWGESPASFFVSGLFATLLATPCSAPFLGTAMGFALTQSAGVILMIFAAVGSGMSLPYFVLAVFPGSLHWLPKPGAWMGKLRALLGALLAATALWLFSILLTQIGHPLWRPAVPVASPSSIVWNPFEESAIELLLKSGRPVFVDVTADWCVTCKVNERLVLQDADVISEFKRRGVVMMRADWTNHSAVIGDYLARHGRAGIPFYALYIPHREPVILSELLRKKNIQRELRTLDTLP